MRELTVIRPGPSSTTDRKRVTLRTAKGSHYGPQKGHITDRQRVILRTAKGSYHGPQQGHHGPKGHNMGQRGHTDHKTRAVIFLTAI